MDTNFKVLLVVAVCALIAVLAYVAVGVNDDDGGNPDHVTYYGNGGTHEGDSKITSEIVTVLECMFINGDKGFYGWNTKSDATGEWFFGEDTVHLGISLYAIWVDYTVQSGSLTDHGTFVRAPMSVDGRDVFDIYCGYNKTSPSNRPFFSAFNNSFTNLEFISWANDGQKDVIKLSADQGGKTIFCTIEFVHSSYDGPMFLEGSNKINNGSFYMEIIGNGSTIVNVEYSLKDTSA